MTTRVASFSPSEAEVFMEAYEEVQDEIKKTGIITTVIKLKTKAWPVIADHLNM